MLALLLFLGYGRVAPSQLPMEKEEGAGRMPVSAGAEFLGT